VTEAMLLACYCWNVLLLRCCSCCCPLLAYTYAENLIVAFQTVHMGFSTRAMLLALSGMLISSATHFRSSEAAEW